jgi:hypothetical protein
MTQLPDVVSHDENLARVICFSSKPKKYMELFYFDENLGKYAVKVGVFIDDRDPMQLSVNRISTLSLDRSHDLGLRHKEKYQPQLTYHGFAKVLASMCFDLNCKVEKHDYNGTRPYHANIFYPINRMENSERVMEESQAIAVKLAHLAEFVKYTPPA